MNDIDTAAIRARYDLDADWNGSILVKALCDALDAARAERDEVKGLLDDKSRRDDTALMAYKREKHRAEAAEGRHEIDVRYIAKIEARMEAAEAEDYAGLIVRCTAAEARIEAALAEIRDHAYIDWENVERALTGDTP